MQRNECDYCVHYRGKRRLEDLIKLSTDRPNHAVREIREREAQWEDEESQWIIELLRVPDQTRWPGRPNVLPYCGLDEEKGSYLIYELKNVDRQCGDFMPLIPSSLKFCSSCSYRVEASGPKEDYAEMEDIRRKSGDMASSPFDKRDPDSGWSVIKERLQARSERIDNDKSTEMLLALDSGISMPHKPRYYETCNKYSKGRGYVLCRVMNYHGHCPGHSASASRQPVATTVPTRDWNDGGTF